MKKTILMIILLLTVSNINVFAHGASMKCEKIESYHIKAAYDTGEPMSLAQIIIYAPNNMEEPYKVGQCDENGEYNFNIDNEIKGVWTIQARLAGHGASMNIVVDEDATIKQSKTNIMQKIIMSVCVLWGFFGTYMYFSRR
jgi:nickel transport protein